MNKTKTIKNKRLFPCQIHQNIEINAASTNAANPPFYPHSLGFPDPPTLNSNSELQTPSSPDPQITDPQTPTPLVIPATLCCYKRNLIHNAAQIHNCQLPPLICSQIMCPML